MKQTTKQLIYELNEIQNAIRYSKKNIVKLESLTFEPEFYSVANYQVQELIIDALQNNDNALYNIEWCIDILSNQE